MAIVIILGLINSKKSAKSDLCFGALESQTLRLFLGSSYFCKLKHLFLLSQVIYKQSSWKV